MGILTSQQVTTYYERYKETEVIFTKEIIEVAGLITKQISLKCMGDSCPCIIYSSSFETMKIVANIKSGLIQKLQDANNAASIRLCFKSNTNNEPMFFSISARCMGYIPYSGSKEVAIISLQFVQRPPDDLIEIMGRILDAHVNSTKRRGDRILITNDTQRKLNMVSKETLVVVQGVPRQCIIRDIAFYGARVITMGLAKFLEDREAVLTIDFDEPRQSFSLKGRFIRAEVVEGRRDMLAMAVAFDEAIVPLGYKIRINNYISQVRTDNRVEQMAEVGEN